MHNSLLRNEDEGNGITAITAPQGFNRRSEKELLELAMSVSDESEIHTRESLFNKLMKKVESCNEIEEISSEKWSSSGLGNKKSAQNIWNS